MSFIGGNYHAQGIKDLATAIDHVKRAQPNWIVVLDGVETAKQFKAASPKTNVIVRLYMPDGFHYGREPLAYLIEMRKQVGESDLWCYVENEAGIRPEWNTSLLAMNAMSKNPLKLVILNLSVGTPQPEDWNAPQVIELLKLASEYREWCAIGLHEYFDIVPTSGLIGGFPDNAGAQPNVNNKPGETGKDYIQPINWPLKNEVARLSKFHAGRAMFLVAACKAHNIPMPRMVLTEIGQDDLGDMEAWVVRRFGEKIRGYKSALRVWHDLFPQWKEDEAYFNCLKYLVENVWSTIPEIEGGCIYCYGHKDEQWGQFDIEGRSDLMHMIEQYATAPVIVAPPVPIPPEPSPIPKPSTAGEGKRVITLDYFHLRQGYGFDWQMVSKTKGATGESGDLLRIYPATMHKTGDDNWIYADVLSGDNGGLSGWILWDGFEYENEAPPPVVLPPKNDPTLGGLIVPPAEDLVNLVITLKNIPRELASKIQLAITFEIQELVKETA